MAAPAPLRTAIGSGWASIWIDSKERVAEADPRSIIVRFESAGGDTIKKLTLWLPSDLTPPPDFTALKLKDSQDREWTLDRRIEEQTVFTASTTTGPATGAWTLELPLSMIVPAAKQAISGISLRAGGLPAMSLYDLAVPPPVVPATTAPRPRRLWFEPDCDVNVPVPYGTVVTLICRIEGAETADLLGNLPNANSRRVKDKDKVTVWALSPTRYTLSARFEPGRPAEIASIHIDVLLPQQGVKLLVHPRTVLPGGPVAIVYTGVNVNSLGFDIRAENAPAGSRRPPTIDNSRVREGHRRTFRRTYSVPFGPQGPEEVWTFTARPAIAHQFTSNQVLRQEASVNVARYTPSHTALDLKGNYCQMACGVFRATFNLFGGKQEVREPEGGVGRRAMWAALAGPSGLKLVTLYEAQRRAVEEMPPLAKADTLTAVAAAGDPANCRCVIAASWVDGKAAIYRLDALKLANANFTRQAVEPEFLVNIALDAAKGLRLLALGQRIYVLGDTRAYSFLLPAAGASGSIVPVEEPMLAAVLAPHWRLAALPAKGWQVGEGCIYAMDTKTGIFLRFDAAGAKGLANKPTLGKANAASSANKDLAKLDLLAWAQSRITDESTETVDLKALITAGTNQTMWKFEKRPDDARQTSEPDPGCIDARASLVAVAGAVVARCKLPDNVDPTAPVLQDRVYDPSLNVWTRCGHLFPPLPGQDDDADSLVGCVTPAAARIPSADEAEAQAEIDHAADTTTWFFCYRPKTGLLYRLRCDGVLETLGFNTARLEPNPALAEADSAWLGTRLGMGVELRPGKFITSPDSAYALMMDEGGNLRFVRQQSTGEWRAEDWAQRELGHWTKEVTPLWSVPTAAGTAGFLRIDANGDLVLRKDAATVLWTTVPAGAARPAEYLEFAAARQYLKEKVGAPDKELAGAELTITNDGRLRLVTASGVELWRAPRTIEGATGIAAGDWMVPGDTLVRGHWQLRFTPEGNLETQLADQPSAWSVSGDGKCSTGLLTVGRDGQLCLNACNEEKPVWSSEPTSVTAALLMSGKLGRISSGEAAELAGSVLRITDGGSLAMITKSGIDRWHAPRQYTVLAPGNYLLSSDVLVDPANTGNALRFTAQGQLELHWRGASPPAWTSERGGSANAALLSDKGALELYNRADAEPFWSSLYRGAFLATPGSQIEARIVDNGATAILAIRENEHQLWYSNYRIAGLENGCELNGGCYIESPGQKTTLVMERNGLLQLWEGRTLVWTSRADNGLTAPLPPRRPSDPLYYLSARMLLQPDGVIGLSGMLPAMLRTFADGNGRQYSSRGAILQVHDDGFTVWSGKGNNRGVAWYSVTRENGSYPAPGQVRTVNALRCRLFNPSQEINGYMFANGTLEEADHRLVSCRRNGGSHFDDNIWLIEEIEPGKFSIFNEHHREHMCISNVNLFGARAFRDTDKDRRYVCYMKQTSVFADLGDERGLFELSNVLAYNLTSTIRSVSHKIYVYCATYENDGDTMRVLAWNPGNRAKNDEWTFQPPR